MTNFRYLIIDTTNKEAFMGEDPPEHYMSYELSSAWKRAKEKDGNIHVDCHKISFQARQCKLKYDRDHQIEDDFIKALNDGFAIADSNKRAVAVQNIFNDK
ncbi:MAG: hypothetical protein GY679_01715 [Mycoplasma sp.]|nr:hypothetical protein [Mycoplasma sp.]